MLLLFNFANSLNVPYSTQQSVVNRSFFIDAGKFSVPKSGQFLVTGKTGRI